MLHDPRRDVLSLDGLIAWLETMPRRGGYTYVDPRSCLIAQYLHARGWEGAIVRTTEVAHFGVPWQLPPDFNEIAIDRPRTYGAALRRARQARGWPRLWRLRRLFW